MSVSRSATAQAALAIGALGVVFGDIGTSPLYTEQTVFNPGDPHPVKVSTQNVFGIVSLIVWSVVIIVTVTYVLLVMRAEGPLQAFIDQLHAMKPPLPRVPGTAIFLSRGKATAPLALRANVEHNKILHEHVVILAIETKPVPHIPDAERLTVDSLGHKDDRITHVTARFGYMDQQNVPELLPLIRKAGAEGPLDGDTLSYFLSTIEVRRGNTPGMSRWRKRLFVATSRLTADAAEYFQLPRDRTLIMGSRIEL